MRQEGQGWNTKWYLQLQINAQHSHILHTSCTCDHMLFKNGHQFSDLHLVHVLGLLLLLSLGTSLDPQNLNPLLAAPDLSHWMSSWSFPSSSLLWTAGWTPPESSETLPERGGTSSSCKHTGALVKFKAWLKQAFIMTPEASKLQGWPAEELDRQEPGITTERSVLSAAGPNRFVDLGDVGCDVLHGRVVKAVYPQTWVSALHFSLEIVEGPCCMLQGE